MYFKLLYTNGGSMAKKKITDLLDKALGFNKPVDETDAELIALVKESSTVSTPTKVTIQEEESLPIKEATKQTIALHKAYNTYYNKETKKYSLVIVTYSLDGTQFRIEQEEVTNNFSEIIYKIQKIFVDKLKDSLYIK